MGATEDNREKRRLVWLAWIGLSWALLIALRLVQLQIVEHPRYQALADSQQQREVPVWAPRGAITDRSARILAMSLPAEQLHVNPKRIPDVRLYAELIGGVLNLRTKEIRALEAKIANAKARRRGYLVVREGLTPDESDRLRSLKLEWVGFETQNLRVYPKNMLASNLLGSVGKDHDGMGGVELGFNEDLRGQPGREVVLTDVRFRPVQTLESEPALPGKTLGLTIDERIQYIADEAIRKAVRENHATMGSIVVMDPRNGDILALSNYPTFDPNEPVRDLSELGLRLNRAIAAPFEPGSVFKVIPVAAALETTRLRPESQIWCGNGLINVHGQTIRDLHRHGWLSMEDVLAKSSNIGAIQVALQVGEKRLHDYIRRFGLGERTGVGLPSEERGWLRPVSRWRNHSIGYIAMGHEVSVTTLQLAQAVSVIANGGFRVKPRIVLWRQTPDGNREMEPESKPEPAIKPETAITMRRMMEQVVLRGTGKAARMKGYSSGGKTGSAQIFDIKIRRYTHKHNATFMGFAPVPNPRLVVVVTLNGVSRLAGATAAPVFPQVAGPALRFLGLPQDVPDQEMPASKELEEAEVADRSTPPPPDFAPPDEMLQPKDPQEEIVRAGGVLVGPRAPDFHGKSLREVLRESARLGFSVDVHGDGVVRSQEPPPGEVLAAGQKIRVVFAR